MIDLIVQRVQKSRPARPPREKGRGVPLGCVEDLNDARTPPVDFFNTLLTLLCGMSSERAEELLQLRASAGRTSDGARFMFFQRDHDH
jgi:hypothetical protein